MLRNLISRMNTAWLAEPDRVDREGEPAGDDHPGDLRLAHELRDRLRRGRHEHEQPDARSRRAQNAVERTIRGAVSACTSADPMPMSATFGANAASATATAAVP